MAATSVEQYLGLFPDSQRTTLEAVRDALLAGLPGAELVIAYQIPALRLERRNVLYFAGWKQHYAVYPVHEPLAQALRLAESEGKVEGATFRLPWDRPVPALLLTRLAAARLAELPPRAAAKPRKASSGATPATAAAQDAPRSPRRARKSETADG